LPQLSYAIRIILYPNFLLSRIPELLELLWHVDAYRRRVVDISREILIWQRYYKKGGNTSALLGVKEEKKVKDFADETKAAQNRDTYIKTAITCCGLHIYYLFTASESYFLPTRLLEFFPIHRQQGSGDTAHFHWDFSEVERKALDEEGQECLTFVKTATEWERERESQWKEDGLPMDRFLDDYKGRSFKEEFALTFNPPYIEERMIELIEVYLKKVERMVDKLEEYFPRTEM